MFYRFIRASLITGAALLATHTMAASITGSIKDDSGAPIAGATISVEGSTRSVTSDDKGNFQLDGIIQEHVHIHVYSPQHEHGDKLVELDGTEGPVNFILYRSRIENVLVTATPLGRSVLESITPTSVIDADALRKEQAPTLGDSLAGLPGVHSASYGPVSSRPIVRGTDGPRVKVLQNGLDVGDASSVGPDHNVATEAAKASQIEVLRGPSTLPFGSGAIGGVVNIVDTRIPNEVPLNTEGEASLRFDSVANARFGSVGIRGGTDKLALNVNAFKRRTDNYALPSDVDIEGNDELENSDIDAQGFSAGGAWIGTESAIGFAAERLENNYGIAGHAHHEHEHEEEEEEAAAEEESHVRLDAKVTRLQTAASWHKPFTGVNTVEYRAALTDYEHSELEEGTVATLFSNRTQEHRLKLEHAAIGNWHGIVGLHTQKNRYAADGEEAFTPSNKSEMYGLFAVEEWRKSNWVWQVGARIEGNSLRVKAPVDVELHFESGAMIETQLEVPAYSETSLSLSSGFLWHYLDGYSLGASLSHSARAPSHQELFAAGEHLSTQTYELGLAYQLNGSSSVTLNENIHQEKARNVDLTWRKYRGDSALSVTLFFNQVANYIYAEDTGLETDEELPIFTFLQEDAELYGFEWEWRQRINATWSWDIFSDYIRAELDDGEALPRIPPLRIGNALHFEQERWSASLDLTWHDTQNRTTEFERRSDGYTVVDAYVQYQLPNSKLDWLIYLDINNLGDREIRPHTSYLKDTQPQPGRNIALGIEARF